MRKKASLKKTLEDSSILTTFVKIDKNSDSQFLVFLMFIISSILLIFFVITIIASWQENRVFTLDAQTTIGN